MSNEINNHKYYIYLAFSSLLFFKGSFLNFYLGNMKYFLLFFYIGIISTLRWVYYNNIIMKLHDQISVKLLFIYFAFEIHKNKFNEFDNLFLYSIGINIFLFYIFSKILIKYYKSNKSILLHMIMHMYVFYGMSMLGIIKYFNTNYKNKDKIL